MKRLMILAILLSILGSLDAQSADTSKPRVIVNNQFFFESDAMKNYQTELWSYKKAVFGEYDKDNSMLFLSGIVSQVKQGADSFEYFILVDNGITDGQSMVMAIVPELVDQIEVGDTVALFGLYEDTEVKTYSNRLTGVITQDKTPVIEIAMLGTYVPEVGINWLYDLQKEKPTENEMHKKIS